MMHFVERLGDFHKRRQGLSSADILRTRGFFRCGAKTSDFSKFMVRLHGQGARGVEPVRTFCGQRGHRDLCGRFLWTTFKILLFVLLNF